MLMHQRAPWSKGKDVVDQILDTDRERASTRRFQETPQTKRSVAILQETRREPRTVPAPILPYSNTMARQDEERSAMRRA